MNAAVRPGSGQSSPAARQARPALRVAAAVLWLEALGVIVFGVLVLVSAARTSSGVGFGVAGLLIAWGVALALVGRGVALVRQWSRGPAVALQLLQLPIAYGFRHSFAALAIALFVTAAVVLVAVFLPASTAAFTSGRRLPGSGPAGQD